MTATEHSVETLSWDAVARRIADGAAAILPIGAGAKEHGFHLPMNTDRLQAEFLAAQLAQHIDALIWPTLSYGHYPAFAAYAGSINLSAPLFEQMVGEIVGELLRHQCRAVFVLNTGISTIAPVDAALRAFDAAQVLHLKPYSGPRFHATEQKLREQSHGSHADEIETSIMLALAPEVVDMTRAEASPSTGRGVPGPLTPHLPSSPNYSRSGSYGDPTLATSAKGQASLSAMTDDLVEAAMNFLAQAAPAKRSVSR